MPASIENRKPKIENLPALWLDRVAASGSQPAIHVRRDGRYVALTWDEVAVDVRRAAGALARLGAAAGDRVILVAENRYEWIVCDLAMHLLGVVHVPVHASLTGPQIAYQIADCGARLAIVSGTAQVEKLVAAADRLPGGLRVVSLDPCPPALGQTIERLPALWSDVPEAEARAIESRAAAALRPDDLATILYTSGTTGEPKGVMLSHRNLTSNALATVEAFEMSPDDVRLTWLPLSHIFARTCDLYAWIAKGTQLALAESRDTVLANCAEVRPTLINGVPYFFDKVQRYLTESGQADTPGALARLFGDRIRMCCSGGAALPNHTATFYQERGVLLIQGYGLTECAPVMTMNTPQAHRLGTVGRAPRDIEVRIAPDGEVLTRGPHVMLGYWNKPDATAEAVRDGWLYTGDLGELDADGYLRITGRKKELIVTAGGKNIAPVLLESLLTEDPLIAQAVVIGDGRNFLTALVVVNREPMMAELNRLGVTLADDAASGCAPLTDPRVIELYRQRIAARLGTLSEHEQVGRFTLLLQPFTPERDELTPTLKLRRAVISRHYAAAIEAMYRP
jgi:long-chain acyl-CoA synthetase